MLRFPTTLFLVHPTSSWSEAVTDPDYAPTVATCPNDHTMGDSLYGYLDPKVHEWIKNKTYNRIYVVGDNDRTTGVSQNEKRDKMFNWQRPTAELRDNELYIKCFPGSDYVQHYASLIATYLAIHNRDCSSVYCVAPSNHAARDALAQSNLMMVPKGRIAVVGYGLDHLVVDENLAWDGDRSFSWVTRNVANDVIVYTGCRHSFWGDIAGQPVKLLAKLGFQQVIFIGKLGALHPGCVPNTTLATGNSSEIERELIQWDNLFDFAKGEPGICFGDHCSLPSVMFESKKWLASHQDFDFVDPEIGHMAKAARSASIGFSYLHIISDNLAKHYSKDLSNERTGSVKEKRALLLAKIHALLERALHMPTSQPNLSYGNK